MALRPKWRQLRRRHPGRAVISEIMPHDQRDPSDSWEH
jgi:hypothetical protein